jgi:hypothetical protein
MSFLVYVQSNFGAGMVCARRVQASPKLCKGQFVRNVLGTSES